MVGTAITRIKVGKDGKVSDATVVRAHPVSAKYVLSALKEWEFAASEREYELVVTCRFEFYAEEKCVRDDGKLLTPETKVSAELPAEILIRTTNPCIVITTSDPVEP